MLMRKKTFIPSRGHCLWGWQVPPTSVVVSSGDSRFPPHPKDVHVRVTGVCACPSLRDCEVCEWPCDGRASCREWVPALRPEWPREAPATCDTELEQAGWKIILTFFFIHLS